MNITSGLQPKEKMFSTNGNFETFNFVPSAKAKLTLLLAFLFCCFGTFLLDDSKLSAANKSDKDFAIKGFHLDLRIQVMTPDALKKFADEMAEFGLNTLVMEWEGSFPYDKHATISNEYSYTREEVKSFIEYCTNLGIEVIPLQQCFGHVEYILRNNRYSHLREDRKEISQICPIKAAEDNLLFKELITDLVSMHNSEYVHIGGDETYLLGHCSLCSEKAENEGKSKLFVDYMSLISEIVLDLGKIPVMWADIILKHPESAEILPKETVFVDWNYGWNNNQFGDITKLQETGFNFWGAPAIRSHPDNWYITYWEKHFNNQRDFIPYSREAGYEGVIMTSWSTSGVYGFIWDVGYEVMDMEQLRNTYPLSGFRILRAAYAEAVRKVEAIDPQAFALKYAQERFGLSEKDSKEFWKALTVTPELISRGKPETSLSIAKMIENHEPARLALHELKPEKHEKEFEHFRLMADLRAHYLEFKELESIYNSDQFNLGEEALILPRLRELLSEAELLNQRFAALQKGFLFDAEIADQNRLRTMPMQVLYERLKKTR